MDMSAEDPIAERRPAGEFFTDPGARVVWAAVRGLDEGQKHQLLDLLAGELAVPSARDTPSQVRAALAVSASREAARISRKRGRTMLRQEDYRSLRAELGEREGWPPDGSVRRWLGGSWNDALRAARLMTSAYEPVNVARDAAPVRLDPDPDGGGRLRPLAREVRRRHDHDHLRGAAGVELLQRPAKARERLAGAGAGFEQEALALMLA